MITDNVIGSSRSTDIVIARMRSIQSNPRSWLRMGVDCFASLAMTVARAMTIVFVFQSCGFLQNITKRKTKDVAKERTNTAVTQIGSLSAVKTSEGFIFRRDSADKVYTIQFWPKGIFNFSAEKGFVGEAEKVVVNAYIMEGAEVKERKHLKDSVSGNWNNSFDQSREKQSIQKNSIIEKSVSWKLVLARIALLIVAGGSGYFYFRRNLRRKRVSEY